MDKILCFIFGHRLSKVRPLLIGGELYECNLCGKKICVHHGRQMAIDYTPDIEEFEQQIRAVLEKHK